MSLTDDKVYLWDLILTLEVDDAELALKMYRAGREDGARLADCDDWRDRDQLWLRYASAGRQMTEVGRFAYWAGLDDGAAFGAEVGETTSATIAEVVEWIDQRKARRAQSDAGLVGIDGPRDPAADRPGLT